MRPGRAALTGWPLFSTADGKQGTLSGQGTLSEAESVPCPESVPYFPLRTSRTTSSAVSAR